MAFLGHAWRGRMCAGQSGGVRAAAHVHTGGKESWAGAPHPRFERATFWGAKKQGQGHGHAASHRQAHARGTHRGGRPCRCRARCRQAWGVVSSCTHTPSIAVIPSVGLQCNKRAPPNLTRPHPHPPTPPTTDTETRNKGLLRGHPPRRPPWTRSSPSFFPPRRPSQKRASSHTVRFSLCVCGVGRVSVCPRRAGGRRTLQPHARSAPAEAMLPPPKATTHPHTSPTPKYHQQTRWARAVTAAAVAATAAAA